MPGRTLIAVIILFFIPLSFYAKDGDRIDELEQEIENIKIRISELESMFQQKTYETEYASSEDGWKSLSNWRKLTTGMSTTTVQEVLGEPQRIDGGPMAFWYYENGGEVIFMEGKVYSWSEP